MRYVLIAVGKVKTGPEKELFGTYVKRMNGRLELVEVDFRRAVPSHEIKRREAELIRTAVPSGASVVSLDEHGKGLSSTNFAENMLRWREAGPSAIVFVIGGADGLDEKFLAESHFRLAFSAMTWPHKLVRAMLAEQVYRAESIASGHPYHRA